ncbi:MAG: hypothetical protein B6245_21015 [Desulfobacteraceae bacterium 4572_88]|nr:MAG: hypothetical protein B6245_21015 [Desulfobacteraceae bacterium 4572_88]
MKFGETFKNILFCHFRIRLKQSGKYFLTHFVSDEITASYLIIILFLNCWFSFIAFPLKLIFAIV